MKEKETEVIQVTVAHHLPVVIAHVVDVVVMAVITVAVVELEAAVKEVKVANKAMVAVQVHKEVVVAVVVISVAIIVVVVDAAAAPEDPVH